MRKNRVSFFLITTAFFILSATKLSAQITPLPTTTSPSSPGEKPKTWVCMETKPYNARTDSRHITPGGFNRHLIEATVTSLPTDKCIYIVGCIHTPDNIECTTGNAQLDRQLHLVHSSGGSEVPNATYMSASSTNPMPYHFVVDGGSQQCNVPNGDITAIAFSEAQKETTHSLFAVYDTNVEASGNDQSGNASTLKYGQFAFTSGPGACDGQRWDPFGVVFDAKSLEPVPLTSLTLFDNKKVKVVLAGLPNPVQTKADGLFNFLPEPGSYILQPAKSGYAIAQEGDIHPNFTKAYSQIYKTDEVIVEEAGKEEHRDVALLTAGEPYKADPSHINFGVTQRGLQLRVAGKQSHPFTIVSLVQEGQQVAQVKADKYGFYQFNQSNKTIRADAPVDVYFTKVDLTQDNTPIGQAKKAYQTSPVPPYIEGKAYDSHGKVLGGAAVKIKLDMTGKVQAQTTADEGGVFSIPPQNLPPFPYSIEFTPAGSASPIKKSVVDFARENKDYYGQNNVNIMTATKNGRALVVENKVSPTPSSQQPESQQQAPRNIGMIIFLLFVLLLVGVIGLFWYLRRQKSLDMQNPEAPSLN